MRKMGILFFITCLLLLGGCTHSAPQNTTPSSPAPTPLNMQDAFKAILLGKMEFFNVGTAQYLDISRLREAVTSEDLPFTAKQFAIVDLDSDGSPEVILRLAMEGGGNDFVGSEILCCQKGEVYGYTLWHRQFQSLKSDGTFIFSGGASNWGYGAITVSETGYEVDKITYCESGQNSELYFVNRERATADEFEAAIDEREKREDAEWYDITIENIEAGLSASFAPPPQVKKACLSPLSRDINPPDQSNFYLLPFPLTIGANALRASLISPL